MFFVSILTENFSDVQGGLLGTLIALHRPNPRNRFARTRKNKVDSNSGAQGVNWIALLGKRPDRRGRRAGTVNLSGLEPEV
jgi:hypothetical protein